MNQTSQWIRWIEEQAFPGAQQEPPLPRPYVEEFLRKATLLNELMREETDDYVRSIVQRTYNRMRWNRHLLKSFVVIDYPLIVIETIFRQEHIPAIRSVKAGLYPGPAEVNACATQSPSGESVILFSEGLFAYSDDVGQVFRRKPARCRSEATAGMNLVP